MQWTASANKHLWIRRRRALLWIAGGGILIAPTGGGSISTPAGELLEGKFGIDGTNMAMEWGDFRCGLGMEKN